MSTRATFDPQEVEFMSEETMIKIVPLYDMDRIDLITGSIGPFTANESIAEVPLWIAMTLRKKGKCRVIQPDWLKAIQLRDTFEKEVASVSFAAGDDFEDQHLIRAKIEDIENFRHDKMKMGLRRISAVDGPMFGFVLNNISAMEINRNREFVCTSLHNLRQIDGANEEEEDEEEDEQANEEQDDDDN
ncbi:DNA replication complex GINS protein [Acrasis kona]|uniref:DNA replication complex GINS protein n=1 Tax=Acrasis kona TaxID=1008807 RepID=A0AAW2ZS34_9EUKA